MESAWRFDLRCTLGQDVLRVEPLSGGDTCRVFRLLLGDGSTVVAKTCSGAPPGFFFAEETGLAALREAGLRVPEVLGTGEAEGVAWLALSYVQGARAASYCRRAALVAALAKLHSHAAGPVFGGQADNFVGSMPQANPRQATWLDFFATARLEPLLALAEQQGCSDVGLRRGIPRALRALERALHKAPVPALLHGDLWCGNVLADAEGLPVFIDPSVHVGVAEVDLAMAQLFGGFPSGLLEAYRAVSPLEPGYRRRLKIYQLYPLLVHWIRFGGGYRSQIEGILQAC